MLDAFGLGQIWDSLYIKVSGGGELQFWFLGTVNLGNQQKQPQKQRVRIIIQGTEILGKVTGADTCLAERCGSPHTILRDRNLREEERG